MLKYLIFTGLFMSLNTIAAVYDFEDLPSGSFKVIELPGVKIESDFDDVSFVGGDSGRPAHFGSKSIYSSGVLTITFPNPVAQIGISVTPFKKGRANLECQMVDTQTGLPYRGSISDTTFDEMTYGQFDNVGASPWRRYKLTKCTIKVIDEGIWIDSLGITE